MQGSCTSTYLIGLVRLLLGIERSLRAISLEHLYGCKSGTIGLCWWSFLGSAMTLTTPSTCDLKIYRHLIAALR